MALGSVTHYPSQQPAIQALSDGQARGLMKSLIESRQWWVFPLVNDDAVELAAEIERRHYAGAANRDRLLLPGPTPALFAHKRRMPVATLARSLAELCTEVGWSEAQWRSAVAGPNILVGLRGEADGDETLARLVCWHAWLVARS